MKFLVLICTMLLTLSALADESGTQTLDERGEPVFDVLLNVNGHSRPERCCGGHHLPRECPCPFAPPIEAAPEVMSMTATAPNCRSDLTVGQICRTVEGRCQCYWHTTK